MRDCKQSYNIHWAGCWHVQTSLITGLKDFNVEGDTEIVNNPIEDDKQDEEVVPVVLVPVQDTVLETPVPVAKQTRFQFSEAVGKSDDGINKYASKKAKLEQELKSLEGCKEDAGKHSTQCNFQLNETTKESMEEIDYAEVDNQDDDELFQSEEGIERFSAYSTTLASDSGEPKHYKEAMRGDERKQWSVAIKNKINNFYGKPSGFG